MQSPIPFSPEQAKAELREQRARTRRIERHTAASLRALGQEALAEYKANRVLIGSNPLRFASPYLVSDVRESTLIQARGIADGLALRLRFSDAALHRQLQPQSSFARVVFDILEQLRCESLADASLAGVRSNLDEAFDSWCSTSRINGFAESDLGILLYTLIHMVRSRLIRNIDNEDVAALIEATRANIAPLIGTPFYHLPKARFDQRNYAAYAIEIAQTLAELVEFEEDDENVTAPIGPRVFALPPDWEEPPEEDQQSDGGPTVETTQDRSERDLADIGDYHVFTRELDCITSGSDLYRETLLRESRKHLDQLIAAQSVSISRLALRLQKLFATLEPSDWFFGQEEGWLDARRLSQLVTNPSYRQVFYQQRHVPESDVVVSFLVDTSGSMKSQRYEAVAVLVDTYARALELAGIRVEILGYTTASWNGGRVMQQWRAAGMPEAPGRLSELQHIVYKDANATWRNSRYSIAAMLKTFHYREAIDGEALLWAWERLLARPEAERYLVMISDGSPMDAATANANRDEFLLDHLVSAASHIDQRSPVHLGCISIDLDTSFFITNSIDADLNGTLGNSSYHLLDQLFRNVRH